MTPGIRATVEFPSPTGCRVAAVAAETGAPVEGIWTSVGSTDGEGSVTEFQVETDDPPDLSGVELVLTIGRRHLLRLEHHDDPACPCERLGAHGCAIQHYAARSGRLRLVFNAADFAELQTVVGDLRDRFPDLDVRRLVRSPEAAADGDVVFVDRGKLTERQHEVLQLAYRRGYFERPRRTNGSAIAAELGVDQSTFAEHLASAQRKLLGDVLEDGS